MLSAIELYKLKDKTFGEKVVWLRKHKCKNDTGSMTTKELAAEIGLGSSSTIFNLEHLKDGKSCKLSTIIDVADYFDVSIDWLLSRPNVGNAYCDLNSVCNYTGLNGDAIDYIANKKTDYCFKVFIEFLIDYAKNHKGFINSLSFLRKSALQYHSEIEFQNILSNYYEHDNLSDENKKALYKLYKGNQNIPPTKTQLYILASLKSDYNSTKYEISEKIRDILNEYSTSNIINENSNQYFPYSEFQDDETKLLNSDYIANLKEKIKEGEENEEKES